MNNLVIGVGKMVLGLTTEYGITKIVDYAVAKVVPEGIKVGEKIAITFGTAAVSWVVSSKVMNEAEKQWKELTEFFKPEPEKEDSDELEVVVE